MVRDAEVVDFVAELSGEMKKTRQSHLAGNGVHGGSDVDGDGAVDVGSDL